jgi:hypothetical protein
LNDKINSLKNIIHEARRHNVVMHDFFELFEEDLRLLVPRVKSVKNKWYKKCWLSEHDFSCFTILLKTILRVACPTVKASVLNPTSGDTPVKSTHACFSPIHSCMITSAGNICRFKSRSYVDRSKSSHALFFSQTFPLD